MGDTEKTVSFTVKVKDAASAALKDIEKAGEGVTEKLFGFKDILRDLTAAAAGFSLAEIVKDMIDLGVASDKTFRQIAANLPTFTEGINELKEGIEHIADASGRSIEGMQQSAAAIAKMGVSSAAELKQQLEAATMLADATGTSVDESAQLLIQLRREFHLTGDEALDTAAKIASVSQGKIGITELMSAFQASVPVFEKFHIDADTGVRAIAALVAAGYTTSRAIRGELGQLDADGIEKLAEQATVASNALGVLKQRADEVRDSTAATNTKLKNEFTQGLEDLGTRVLPTVNKYLAGMIAALDLLKQGNYKAIFAGFFGDQSDVDQFTGADIDNNSSHRTTGVKFTKIGNGAPPKTAANSVPAVTLPQSAAEKEAEAKLTIELQNLARASEEAKLKTLDLAKAQGQDLTVAIEQALAAATGNLAEQASRAIDDRADKLGREILMNQALSAAEKERLLNAIRLTSDLDKLGVQGQHDVQASSLTVSAVGLEGHSPIGDINALEAAQLRLLDDRRAYVAAGKDTTQIDQALLAIEKARAEILKTISRSAKEYTEITRLMTQDIRAQAEAIMLAVEGAVRFAEAMGIVDQHTGNILQSIGQIATGIKPLLDQIGNLGKSDEKGRPLSTIGSVMQAAQPIINGTIAIVGGQQSRAGQTIGGAVGGAETGAEIGSIIPGVGTGIGAVVGGLAGAASGLLGLTHSAAQSAEALRKLKDGQDSVASTLASWRAQISGTAQDQKAAALLQLRVQYEQIVQTIESTEAGRKQEDQRNKDLAEAAKLYGEDSTALENNTAAMLTNTGILNAVQGYKLNLQLFNFSPAYGPPADPSSGSGGSSSGGGPNNRGGGGTATDRGDQTIYVVLDGKIVATSVVKNLRKMSQAQYGTTSRWSEVTPP